VAMGWALTATGEGPSGGGVYTKVVDKATVCEISVHGRVLRAASLTSSSRVRLADGARATAERARVSTTEVSLLTGPCSCSIRLKGLIAGVLRCRLWQSRAGKRSRRAGGARSRDRKGPGHR
jgi:hypothetical protein